MSLAERIRLEKLSVKELRRQAAVKNVPLTQISAAVEKADLINLIIRAGPVLDTYDMQLGTKVHSATSIAEKTRDKTTKDKDKYRDKKKKRRRPSSSSSSRGRRRKRSKSRRRASPPKKRSKSRKPSRSRSSSESLQMIIPPTVQMVVAKALPPVPRKPRVKSATGLKALPDIDLSETAPAVPPPPAPSTDQPSIAQRGMAAAAALGFDVLPKAPGNKLSAPAEGLRPTINTAAPAPYGAALTPGSRICIQYLCTSKCDLGRNCPEAHIIDPEEEMRARARFKDQECHYGAQCTRPGCLFRHPGEKLEEGQFIPEGQQVSLRSTAQGMTLEFT